MSISATAQTPDIQEYLELKQENARLKKQLFEMSTVKRELDLALEEIGRLREDKENYRQSYLHVNDSLQVKAKADIRRKSIYAIKYTNLGPYAKLLYDVLPTEIARRDASGNTREDGMTWVLMEDLATITGGHRNTLTKAMDELVNCGLLAREYETKKRGVKSDIYLKLLEFKPAEIKSQEERKVGGDRRCPQCGGFCKKKVSVTYTCEPCGIEFDKDMNVVDHPGPAISVPAPEAAPVEVPIQEELTEQVNEPIPFVRRPIVCHCGIKSRWVDINGKSHCTNCEMEYRSYAS